jgi:hypothetical protein
MYSGINDRFSYLSPRTRSSRAVGEVSHSKMLDIFDAVANVREGSQTRKLSGPTGSFVCDTLY